MALAALPIELLSRICKVLGRHYDSDGYLAYHQKDFGALRLTCRAIYEKTIYDAAVRFTMCAHLEDTESELDEADLAELFLVSKTAYLRDRIGTLHLYDWAEGMSSPEVVYLLAACLEKLRHAQKLRDIVIISSKNRSLPIQTVLTAMHLSKFPHKLVRLGLSISKYQTSFITPGFEVEHGYRPLIDFVSSHSSYIKEGRLSLSHPRTTGNHGLGPELHDLQTLLGSLKDMNALGLSGCAKPARLRLCQVCHESFASMYDCSTYPHLTTLKLECMYISGGRLRRFIKDHANTLVDVEFCRCTLTDGTWRSVAQGLLKLSQLKRVHFWDELFQKKAQVLTLRIPTDMEIISDPNSIMGCKIDGIGNVRRFLQAFLQHFHTTPCSQPIFRNKRTKHRRILPQYHKVCLVKPSDLPVAFEEVATYVEFERYANEVD